jgi:hypothetical protein
MKWLLSIVVLILIAAAGWALFVHFTGFTFSLDATPDVPTTPTAAASNIVEIVQPSAITVRHTRSGTTHTYSGTFPTSICEDISSGVQTIGINPTRVDVLLTGTVAPNCNDNTPSSQDFSVSVDVASGTPIFGTLFFNGAEIPHQLVEK